MSRDRILIIGGSVSIEALASAVACMGNRDIAVLIDDPPKRHQEIEDRAIKAITDICTSSEDFCRVEKYDDRPKSNEPFYRSLPKFKKRRKQ